jgi:uncharacterized surface protein with fasciclin (FAS1) repeats
MPSTSEPSAQPSTSQQPTECVEEEAEDEQPGYYGKGGYGYGGKGGMGMGMGRSLRMNMGKGKGMKTGMKKGMNKGTGAVKGEVAVEVTGEVTGEIYEQVYGMGMSKGRGKGKSKSKKAASPTSSPAPTCFNPQSPSPAPQKTSASPSPTSEYASDYGYDSGYGYGYGSKGRKGGMGGMGKRVKGKGKRKGKGGSYPMTAAEFVSSNPDLTSLEAAVLQARFGEALATLDPITLFAPNDSAFNQLPPAILATLLLDDEFIPHLQDLLLYHTIEGEVFSSDLSDGLIAATFNGETVTITLPPIAVNGNAVVTADNKVANGVVHIVDGVLIPSWVSSSLTDRVIAESDLSTLLDLVVLAEVDLAVSGAFTLLAPTNDAFAALPADVIALLTSLEGLETLLRVLTYHVLEGIYTSEELIPIQLQTIEGGVVTVRLNPVMFNDSNVVDVDILANNGVLHKIDQVLDPDYVSETMPWHGLPGRDGGRGGRGGRGKGGKKNKGKGKGKGGMGKGKRKRRGKGRP